MRRHHWLTMLVTLVLAAFAFAACGDDDEDEGGGDSGGEAAAGAIERNPANAKIPITVGSKNFTEQKVLGEIYAQGLEAAGYKVDKQLNLGDEKTALKALEGGEIRRLPRVHGHGARVVLRGATRTRSRRTSSRHSRTPRPASPRRA